MIGLRQDWLIWAAALMAALVVLTTGFYTLHSATGVPFWDMFDGNLQFETLFSQGHWGILWAQHNEHRIVLAKLLFLLDLQIARGTTPFLHVVNFLLAGAIAWVLLLFSRRIVGGPHVSILNALIVAMCFSILQQQNFEDAFQSQFFLACLLPLLSIYFAHRSVQDGPGAWGKFFLAVFCAMLSILTMANGVFALPILFVFAILMAQDRRRIVTLAILSALGFLIYFAGYKEVTAKTSPFQGLKDPLGVFLFLCVYMGHSVIAGLLIIFGAVGALAYYLPRRRFHSAEIALLGFIGFVLLTGTITALGRVSFGLWAAQSSRYATPALAAVSALFILYRPMLRSDPSAPFWRKQKVWRWIGLGGVMLVLSGQEPSLRWAPDRNFSHVMGALALELGLADPDIVVAIYPDAEHALMTSERVRLAPKMIWAMAPMKDAKLLIGSQIDAPPPTNCKLSVDKVTRQIAKHQMQRWDGWIGLPADQMIYLTDANGTIFGIGLIGGRRDDVHAANAELGNRTGFGLYAVQPLPNAPLYLGTKLQRCVLSEQENLK